MVKVAAAALLATASAATFAEIAESVNAAGVSWKAAAPEKFASVEDVKPFLGTILKDEEGYKPMDKEVSEVPNVEIPAEFDVRTAFPDCAEVSGNIRDQSSCGSCWAFGSTEAFNDRHCIATGSKVKLSVEDTTANCGFLQCFSMGCNGGQPGQAWNWFKNKGVVTGGDYFDIGKGDSCGPYTLAPCAHHVPATDKYPACPSSEYSTPSISECSESAYPTKYADDKIKATDSYSLNGIQAIQADMVQYGSATAAFTVYDDFPTYKSGVYKKTSNNQLGGHAVKLLGWGTENGEDYWLVANSWNEQWGDNGTFKIARGINECGIEGQVSAGRAGSTNVETSGGTLAVTWEDCGDASTHGHITDLQPSTLQVGSAGTLTGTGTLDEELTGGDFTIKFTALLGITETYTGKVCEAKTFQLPLGVGSVSWLGFDCPVAAGTITQQIGFETKSTIPAQLAKVEFDVSATDQNGAKALCVINHLEAQSNEFSV